MLAYFFAAVSAHALVTAVNGANNTLCLAQYPCNFKNALNFARDSRSLPNLTLVFHGPPVETYEDLNDFRILATAALNAGRYVLGENITINGTNWNETDPFMVIEAPANMQPQAQLDGFTFTGFNSSVLVVRTMEKGQIKNCNFVRNRATQGLGVVSFGFGKLWVIGSRFAENIVKDTAVIHSFTTMLFMDFCVIEHNHVEEGHGHPIVFFSNSVIDFRNVSVYRNTAAGVPLMRFSWRSFFNMYNSTFTENYNSHVLSCDGVCSVLAYESQFLSNRGMLYESRSSKGELIFNEAVVHGNSANDRPLIELHGGNLTVERTTLFTENSGEYFIRSRGTPTKVSMMCSYFHRNSFARSAFSLDPRSSVMLTFGAYTNNTSPDGFIDSDGVSLLLMSVEFVGNHGRVIRCHDCRAKLFDISVINSTDTPLDISAESMTWIVGSQFMGVPRSKPAIVHRGSSLMFGVRFSHSREQALPSGHCLFCEFNQTTEGYYSVFGIAFTVILVIAAAVFAVVKLRGDFVRFFAVLKSKEE